MLLKISPAHAGGPWSQQQPSLKPCPPTSSIRTWSLSKSHKLHEAWSPGLLGVVAAAGVRPLQPLEDSQDTHQILLPVSNIVYKEKEFVDVGTITGAFGIAGEIRVEITTDNPKQRFRKNSKLYLHPPRPTGLLTQALSKDQPLYQVVVQSSKVRILPKGQQVWVLKCGEVPDRDAAEQLSGYKIVIPITQREQLKDPDEFWVQDLVGCNVILQSSGHGLGVVVDVISGTGTYDTIVVQLNLTAEDITNSSTRRCMVPFAKAMCPEVDLREGRILVNPPEGLLDLVSRKPMGKKLRPEQKEAMLAELAAGRQPSLARTRSAPRSGPTTTGSDTSTSGFQGSQADVPAIQGASSSSGGAVAGPRRKLRGVPQAHSPPAVDQQDCPLEDGAMEQLEDGEGEVWVEEQYGKAGRQNQKDQQAMMAAADKRRWLRMGVGAPSAIRRGGQGLRGQRGLRRKGMGSREGSNSNSE